MARCKAKRAGRPKAKGKGKDRRLTLDPAKYLTVEQVRKLLAHVGDKADAARHRGSRRAVFNEFLVTLLLKTGLRAQEACDLNMADLPTAHGKPLVLVRNGKGGVRRTVMVGEKLARRIKRHVASFRNAAGPDEPLLLAEGGGRLGYMSAYQKLVGIGKAARLGVKLTPHVLRHSYAMRLYAVERDLLFVQAQLGHADPATTAIYARTLPADADGQLRKLEADD